MPERGEEPPVDVTDARKAQTAGPSAKFRTRARLAAVAAAVAAAFYSRSYNRN
jgi:hypothetical protein